VALALTPSSRVLSSPKISSRSSARSHPLSPLSRQEAVPGNIRKAEHFVSFLKKIVEYFKRRLKGTSVEKVSCVHLTPLSSQLVLDP
jgi:DNA excision repair protein ERCC-2